MIVLEVPSRYLLIDESSALAVIEVLQQATPLEPISYDLNTGFTRITKSRDFPQIKLYPDTHIQVDASEVPNGDSF